MWERTSIKFIYYFGICTIGIKYGQDVRAPWVIPRARPGNIVRLDFIFFLIAWRESIHWISRSGFLFIHSFPFAFPFSRLTSFCVGRAQRGWTLAHSLPCSFWPSRSPPNESRRLLIARPGNLWPENYFPIYIQKIGKKKPLKSTWKNWAVVSH